MVAKIIGILTLVGLFFGGFAYLDKEFCKKFAPIQAVAAQQNLETAIQVLSKRVESKIESDNLIDARKQLWNLEDRYGSDVDKVSDPLQKQRMKELKVYIETQQGVVIQLRGK